MITTAICLLSLLQQDQPKSFRQIKLLEPDGAQPRLMIYAPDFKLDPPKISPKNKWLFEWVVTGLVRDEEKPSDFKIRFRVFSQFRKENDTLLESTARMLLRLWDFNRQRLKLDHSEAYKLRLVDFYLCYGGPPGGEQLFDEDEEGGSRDKVNTAYIYQISTFTNPVEMAREIAHEYGHATLPPIGIYKEPEDWANGNLGERLYLKWLLDEVRAKRYGPDDMMGATETGLAEYVKTKVNPLVAAAAAMPPDMKVLGGTSGKACDAYLGLALYAEQLLPLKVFQRAMVLTGSAKATDFAKSIVEAAQEPTNWTVRVPRSLVGTKIWIPLVKGKLSGTPILQRSGDWAQILPGAGPVLIKNPEN